VTQAPALAQRKQSAQAASADVAQAEVVVKKTKSAKVVAKKTKAEEAAAPPLPQKKTKKAKRAD